MIRWLAIATLIAAPLAASADARSWNFRVLLDGSEIGRHSFVLADRGAHRQVVSRADFDVRFMFLSVYRYMHRATETWRDGCLVALDARTETNGDLEVVRARTRSGRLLIERGDVREALGGCVMSFAYWDPRILDAQRLLNSQTGELLPVSVKRLREESVRAGGTVRAARRYLLSAPGLSIDLWYAGDEWLALEALADGGRRLRYELT